MMDGFSFDPSMITTLTVVVVVVVVRCLLLTVELFCLADHPLELPN